MYHIQQYIFLYHSCRNEVQRAHNLVSEMIHLLSESSTAQVPQAILQRCKSECAHWESLLFPEYRQHNSFSDSMFTAGKRIQPSTHHSEAAHHDSLFMYKGGGFDDRTSSSQHHPSHRTTQHVSTLHKEDLHYV